MLNENSTAEMGLHRNNSSLKIIHLLQKYLLTAMA
jgi:hypothetical protein